MNALVMKKIEIVKRNVAVITSINGLSTTVAFNSTIPTTTNKTENDLFTEQQ